MIGFTELPEVLRGNEDLLIEWLGDVASSHEARIKGLQYTFLDDKGIRDMNIKHLDHDYATDIITFGYEEGKRINGEVFIGWETVQQNAKDLGVEYREELCRVLAHGLLHMIGFDDHSDEEKKVMRNEEEKCLILRPKKLKSNNL